MHSLHSKTPDFTPQALDVYRVCLLKDYYLMECFDEDNSGYTPDGSVVTNKLESDSGETFKLQWSPGSKIFLWHTASAQTDSHSVHSFPHTFHSRCVFPSLQPNK